MWPFLENISIMSWDSDLGIQGVIYMEASETNQTFRIKKIQSGA